jgi:hypothetical protein
MQLAQHNAADFAEAIRALMPPGVVWEWGQGAASGLGDALMAGPAQELARVDAEANPLLAAAVDLHRPKALSWRLVDYRAVAQVGQSSPVIVSTRRPFSVGNAVGDQIWSGRARYALVVSHQASAAELMAMRQELEAFKQAHVAVFFISA